MLSDSRWNLNTLYWDKSLVLSPRHVICGCSQDSAAVRTHHRGRCAKQSALHISCSLSAALHRGKCANQSGLHKRIAQSLHSTACASAPSYPSVLVLTASKRLLTIASFSLKHTQGSHYQLTRVPFLLRLGAAYVSSGGWDVDATGVQCMLHKS